MLLKYITFRKIKLLFLLKISYHLSYFFKNNKRWGSYISMSIEPVNACNLSCVQCPTGTNSLNRTKGIFDLKVFENLIQQNYKDLLYLNFYFQGEPFLNKDLTKMILFASSRKIYTSVSTNAQLITKDLATMIVSSGLNRIIISIDGADQTTYEKYRKGGSLSRVLKGVEYLVDAKEEEKSKYPKIVFQFLVFKHNEHQIAEIKKLSKTYKADKLEIKSAQVYHFEKDQNTIPSIDKYSRYRLGANGEYKIKNKLQNKCWRMWHSVVLTQDYNAVPCCFDKDAENVLGNIQDKSLSDIQKSTNYKKFINRISKERKKITMCQNCTEGLVL